MHLTSFSPFACLSLPVPTNLLCAHRDLVHLKQTFGITHLHYDTVPPYGGDILWASGYLAYCKLSPAFREFIDGKKAVMRSGDSYIDENNPEAGRQPVTEIHPIVRVHPVTGWKCLFVNANWVVSILGLEKAESDMVIKYLVSVYENNADIQCRLHWTPGTSAIWDNRYVYLGRHFINDSTRQNANQHDLSS